MVQLSDYMQGYNNGWRDGIKDYKERDGKRVAELEHEIKVQQLQLHLQACKIDEYELKIRQQEEHFQALVAVSKELVKLVS